MSTYRLLRGHGWVTCSPTAAHLAGVQYGFLVELFLFLENKTKQNKKIKNK